MDPNTKNDRLGAEDIHHHEIAAIGEVLWDVFPTGPRFGGAPANFACALAGLSRRRMTVNMISAIGRDELGSQAIASLKRQHVHTDHVARIDKPTGEVQIMLDDSGSASYRFAEDCAWDNLTWSQELESLAPQLAAVCFGTLGQRCEVSRQTIRRFVQTTSKECLRIYDINLRPPFYSEPIILDSLRIANILKMNDEELPFLAKLFKLSGNEDQLVAGLAQTCELETIALTRGANGAMIYHDGVISDFRGVKTNVVDTVGAGDAYTAAMTIGLLEESDLDDINQSACKVAAYVCSQPGATPQIPRDLLSQTNS